MADLPDTKEYRPLITDNLVQVKISKYEHEQLKQQQKQQQPAILKSRLRKFLFTFLVAIFCTFLVLSVWTLRIAPEFNQYRLVRTYSEQGGLQNEMRSILLWNDFFGSRRWNLPDDTLGPAFFRDDLRCPVYHCELTHVRDFLPSIDMFDAVLFHAAQPFPILNSVPSKRSPTQIYAFTLMEPPSETKHILSDEGDFYNVTMTYRLDSDILFTYMNIMDLETGVIVAPAKYPIWRQPPTEWNDTTVWNLWHNKTKTAAWFVSHCETLSLREKLTERLQRYVDVDVFGKCGNLSCPHSAPECDNMLDEKYKFYLSFENALCTDYVTEKIFNALKRNIVPIVFGGAVYGRFLPPHSYINAEDFDSVESLAHYLKQLASNPKEYMRFFWWRRYYSLTYHSPYCDLCELLHTPAFKQKRQTYQNIEKWWLQGSCRLETNITF